MLIQSFEFDAGLSAAFAAFREDLYRGDSNWISSPPAEFLSQFAQEFPFYRRPGNRHRHFNATANGKTVGHVSAFVNVDLKDRDGASVGSLGFFECVDDYAVAEDLLNQAIGWLAKENNLHRIWAPVNFDIWHGYRLMTRGFSERTFYGEPYNKHYYADFFTRFGFSVKKIWDSLEIKGRVMLENTIARFEPRYQSILQKRYRFESIDLKEAIKSQQLYEVLLRSYQNFLATTPFDFDDFDRLLGRYLQTFETHFVNLVYDPSGNVAAFSVAYPDYADALRAARLHLQPGLPDRVIFYMIGATPEEVERRHGTGSAIFYYTMRQILDAGFDTVLFAIIADDSGGRRHVSQQIHLAQRSYALYEVSR